MKCTLPSLKLNALHTVAQLHHTSDPAIATHLPFLVLPSFLLSTSPYQSFVTLKLKHSRSTYVPALCSTGKKTESISQLSAIFTSQISGIYCTEAMEKKEVPGMEGLTAFKASHLYCPPTVASATGPKQLPLPHSYDQTDYMNGKYAEVRWMGNHNN